MRADVVDWLGGENVSLSRVNGAINDGVEALWEVLILAAVQIMMGGPVTIALAAGDEGRILVSIADPTVAPTLSDVVLGSLASHAVVAGYTLVTESGSETLLSPTSTRTVAINNVLSIAAPAFVSGAIGWNAYVGTSGRMAKQNAEPIPFGTAWQEAETGSLDDPQFPSPPQENSTGDNIFYIRHLEFQTSSGMYKSYNAGDLDSDFMRSFAGSIAATSEYQNYAWDLINQRQLEIRPAVGQAFSPRYFYVMKPRRMRFDNAPLPFPTIPSTEFIRNYALSLIFLSLHEYDASQAWDTKADKALIKAVRAVTAMHRNRNDRVTPFSIR